MLTPFFVKQAGAKVENFADATACDTAAYAKFFRAMLDSGVYLAPSQFEAMFVGLAHTPEAIEQTLAAARRAMSLLKQ